MMHDRMDPQVQDTRSRVAHEPHAGPSCRLASPPAHACGVKRRGPWPAAGEHTRYRATAALPCAASATRAAEQSRSRQSDAARVDSRVLAEHRSADGARRCQSRLSAEACSFFIVHKKCLLRITTH